MLLFFKRAFNTIAMSRIISKPYSLPKMLLILLITLILPLNIFSLIIATIIIHDARAAIDDSIHVTLTTYTNSIDQIIYNSEYQLYYILNRNTDSIPFLYKTDSLEYELSKIALSRYLLNSKMLLPQADVFYFYRSDLEDMIIIPHNVTYFSKHLLSNDNLTNSTLESGIWHTVLLNDTYYLTKQLNEGNITYGTFTDLDAIVSSMSATILYPINRIEFSAAPLQENSSEMLISSKCKNADIYLNIFISKAVLNTNISIMRWVLILLSIIFIILIPTIYHFISKWVLNPLRILNLSHAKLEHGLEEYRIENQANFIEFQKAYQSFNNMAESLQTLRLEKINTELAHKQMMLDNLQLQIRPHFLLNSFNLLYSMIQTQKIIPAQSMILYISEYFRYLFKYDQELVLFPKEWDLVERYIEISKFQFTNSFTFQYTFDPEISLVRIPPLLLHNFIENILSHALVRGKIVHIMVTGFYDNGIVTFQIADDGCGMSKEVVDHINHYAFDEFPKGSHLGLRNSIRRLKFFYNNTGSVHVDSTPNEGAVFTISFNYNLEETGGRLR